MCPPFCSTPQKIQFKADLSKRNRNSGTRELLTKKNQRTFPWVIKQDRNPASNSGSEEDGRGPPGRGRLPALVGKQLSWTRLLPWEPAGAPRQTTAAKILPHPQRAEGLLHGGEHGQGVAGLGLRASSPGPLSSVRACRRL